METKSLLIGIVSFIAGALLVSTAAVTIEKPESAGSMQHGGSMSVDGMTANLENKEGDDFDRAFLADMIVHHEGAVAMARLAQERAKHGEIKELSGDIISAQEIEIAAMKEWQEAWGYDEEPAGSSH